MSVEEWVAYSQIAQGVGSVLAVFVTLYIAVLVQSYTRKKDRFDLVRDKWENAQAMNLAVLSGSENLRAFEAIVYGSRKRTDVDTARKYFLIFIIINHLQHFFLAYKSKLISTSELISHCEGSAKLLKNEESTVKYLLRERGYSTDFAQFLEGLIASSTASCPPA